MKPTQKLTMALVACLTLVLGAVAMPALADEASDDRSAKADEKQEKRDEYREKADERRDRAQEKHDEQMEKRDEKREKYADSRAMYREYCAEPENDTVAERCDQAKDNHKPFVQARRSAHALQGAIQAHEHRIAQLEILELRINTAMEDGNLTENETAEYQQKLDRIDAQQQKAAAQLMKLIAKAKELRERWNDFESDAADGSGSDSETDASTEATDEAGDEVDEEEGETEESEETEEETEETEDESDESG